MKKKDKKKKSCFEKKLKRLKGEELNPTRLELVDDELIKAIVAWPYVPKSFLKIEAENVWELVRYRNEEWADIAGFVQPDRMRKISQRLIKLRLIYPDGSTPEDVNAFITHKLGKKLGLKKKQLKS